MSLNAFAQILANIQHYREWRDYEIMVDGEPCSEIEVDHENKKVRLWR